MSALQIVLSIIDILFAIAIIVLFLVQEGNDQGLGAVTGATTDSYYSKAKGRTLEEQLKRWTRDGRDGLTNSAANTGFKTDAKKIVRRANKSFCRAVLSGDDYENIPYATDKLGKDFIYRWW